MSGFGASVVIRDDHPVTHSDDVFHESESNQLFVLDVRTVPEFERGHLPTAVNIPLEELRDRLSELPRDQEITAYCQVGQRGYMAARLLAQHGYEVANLSGGYRLVQNSGQLENQQ